MQLLYIIIIIIVDIIISIIWERVSDGNYDIWNLKITVEV
jgi:hypothetical protein